MLDDIKTLLDIELSDTSKDAKLSIFISRCTNFVKDKTNQTELNDALKDAVMELVLIKYNRSGDEGKTGAVVGPLRDEFYSGSNYVPDSIMKTIYSNRRMRKP